MKYYLERAGSPSNLPFEEEQVSGSSERLSGALSIASHTSSILWKPTVKAIVCIRLKYVSNTDPTKTGSRLKTTQV